MYKTPGEGMVGQGYNDEGGYHTTREWREREKGTEVGDITMGKRGQQSGDRKGACKSRFRQTSHQARRPLRSPGSAALSTTQRQSRSP